MNFPLPPSTLNRRLPDPAAGFFTNCLRPPWPLETPENPRPGGIEPLTLGTACLGTGKNPFTGGGGLVDGRGGGGADCVGGAGEGGGVVGWGVVGDGGGVGGGDGERVLTVSGMLITDVGEELSLSLSPSSSFSPELPSIS